MPSVCRVCRAGGGEVILYALKHENIKRIFEKLTNLKFQCEGRPTEVCCFCYKRLLRCSTLSEMAHKSEKIFNVLAVKGLQITYEAIEKFHLAKVQHLSVGPRKIISLNDQTNEQSSIQVIEDSLVSVKIEMMEEPEEIESAFYANNEIIIEDREETNDLGELEPNHSSAHSNKTNETESAVCANDEIISKYRDETNVLVELEPNDSFVHSNETKTKNSKPAEQSANLIESNEVYCCDICKKKFYSRQKFVPHVRTHELSKLYCCDMCPKKFCTRKRIVAHIKRHNPKKLNICNLCGKKLSSKGNLSRHMSVHTGKKPYRCDKCDILFTQKSHLRRHNLIAISHRTGKKQ